MPTKGPDFTDFSKGGGYVDHGFGQTHTFGEGIYHNNMQGFMTHNTVSSGQFSTNMYGNSLKKHSGVSTMDMWQENGKMLSNVSGPGNFVSSYKRFNTHT